MLKCDRKLHLYFLTCAVLTHLCVCSLIGNRGPREHPESHRILRHKLDPIELIKVQNMKAKVRVIQSFFGDPDRCSNPSPEDTVQLMFATFLDPSTHEPRCGAFKRNADACFSKTLWIVCDPKTKIATIDIYVRDESFDKTMMTDNPQIGRCEFGSGEFINHAIKLTEEYDCNPPEGLDKCPEGTYYISDWKGYKCEPYAKLGSYCESYSPVRKYQRRCNPKEAYCYHPADCNLGDSLGKCFAYMGECKSDSDCSDPSRMYCDRSEGKCKARLKRGFCCEPKKDQCSKGLVCKKEGYYGSCSRRY